jgi:hypothetical protein
LSTSFAACSAERITFALFGRTSTSVAGVAWIAATISAVEGFIVWPPSITFAAP